MDQFLIDTFCTEIDKRCNTHDPMIVSRSRYGDYFPAPSQHV